MSKGVTLQNRAYDLGVNFFDTAAAYGQWSGGKIIGPDDPLCRARKSGGIHQVRLRLL